MAAQLFPDPRVAWGPSEPVTRQDFLALFETDDIEEIRQRAPSAAALIESLFPEPEP